MRCPGQDRRFWKIEDIFNEPCPYCGNILEFWKDDVSLSCSKCGKIIRNKKVNLDCALWCKSAKECLGEDVVENKLKYYKMEELLINELKTVFRNDEKRINHALKVLSLAKEINKSEEGDPLIVKASAILHDIGIHEAEKKYNSSAPKFQEIEGPPIARKILDFLSIDEESIEHICNIIATHHSARDIDTPEFRIIWDSDWIVNIKEKGIIEKKLKKELANFIENIFKTKTGMEIALELYI